MSKEVVIDTNGLGVGLADEMIRLHTDENAFNVKKFTNERKM